MIKLNIGCGLDYRDGFINIDGSSVLGKVDKVIELGEECLLWYFDSNSVKHILANDIIEHLFHWEAVRLLKEFYELLEDGGICEIRVPDCEFIISSIQSVENKLVMLFGGQDIPQGNEEMDNSRKRFPNYFCHKYGWTTTRMWNELSDIGFKKIEFKNECNNFVTIAIK